jgi:hypothetical protein
MLLSSILSRISVKQLWRTSTRSTTSRMASSTTSSFGFAKLPVFSISTNGQIDLPNQNCLQQQHVDWKISNSLLKKGTLEAYKTWTQDCAWVDTDRSSCFCSYRNKI